MVTWKKLIEDAMKTKNDGSSTDELVHLVYEGFDTISPRDFLARKFDSGYGCSEGFPFTAWTKTRVYFPVVYDGAEWVESVPRDPCSEITYHLGG